MRQPWTGEVLGPTGGIRACIRDMARLAAALFAGSTPGVANLWLLRRVSLRADRKVRSGAVAPPAPDRHGP